MLSKFELSTQVFQSQLRAAIKTHDKTLDLKGPTGSVGGLEWRTNPVPFDEKLKKKKKFKKIKNDKFTPSVGRENHPHVVAEQFSRLCRSERLFCCFPHLSRKC